MAQNVKSLRAFSEKRLAVNNHLGLNYRCFGKLLKASDFELLKYTSLLVLDKRAQNHRSKFRLTRPIKLILLIILVRNFHAFWSSKHFYLRSRKIFLDTNPENQKKFDF